MVSNFSVFKHQTGENLHLILSGGFDGPSAYKLTKILDEYYGQTKKIVVHTSGISAMHSFGMDILKIKYSMHGNLVFT